MMLVGDLRRYAHSDCTIHVGTQAVEWLDLWETHILARILYKAVEQPWLPTPYLMVFLSQRCWQTTCFFSIRMK